MADSGIQFFHRHTGRIETEVVYGEKWLRFILFNPFGQLALHTVAKRAWFSRWYGWRMSGSQSKARVRPFIEKYGITEYFSYRLDYLTKRLILSYYVPLVVKRNGKIKNKMMKKERYYRDINESNYKRYF